jgi:PHD/YefM family antitoxin component YafN of YafNO toxin-antitoxin module
MGTRRFVHSEELKQRPEHLLRMVAASGETHYITEAGKAKAVLMDINRYNALMDIVEEAESPRPTEVGDETRQHVSVRGIIKRGKTTRMMRRQQP